MAINIVREVDDFVEIKNVIISVSNKAGLEKFVLDLLEINPGIRIFSTGGTFSFIEKFLKGKGTNNLIQVSDYTKQPETQGGLVKTLDFKIYLGILTEKYNESHQADLRRTGAVPIDMVVVNLYPFKETIEKAGTTVEEARANVDIGGPCMIRAAAKNYLRVASVVDPDDYEKIISKMKTFNGKIDLETRFELAKKAFTHTKNYDETISNYLLTIPSSKMKECYEIMDAGE